MNRRSIVILVSLLVLGFAQLALAQRDLGTISGTVTDQTGAIVAGARITLTEAPTGLKYEARTDSFGNYIRPALKPSTYSIAAEAVGFKTTIQDNVLLTAGDIVQVNLTLQVGSVSQTLEVTSSPTTLQTQSTIIGQNISEREVDGLPLGGQRTFTFFATLSEGVVPGEPGDRTAGYGGFSTAGMTAMGQDNMLLNGVDNNANVIDFFNGASYVVAPPIDAIGEVKVLTNGYNAEYGRAAGGVLDVNIKSGTNRFHGSAYEYVQNKDFDANSWEANKAGTPLGPFRENQFGGSLGGPIIKDKTFFFVDYQGTRIASMGGAVSGLGGADNLIIPYPEMTTGDYSRELGPAPYQQVGTDVLGRPVYMGEIFDPTTTQVVNGTYVRNGFGFDPVTGLPISGNANIIPPGEFDSAAAKLMALYPTPNENLTSRYPTNDYFTETSGSEPINQFDVRVDHRLTNKDSIFGSLSWSTLNSVSTAPINNPLDGGQWGDGNISTLGRNFMVSWTRSWSPTVLTESRIGYSRLISKELQFYSNQNLQQQFGIGGYNYFDPVNGGLPMILLNDYGYTTVGQNTYLPSVEHSLVYDWIENLAVVKGKHAMKFGFEGRQIKFPFIQPAAPRGQWDFNMNQTNQPGFAGTGESFASFLVGYPEAANLTSINEVASLRYGIAGYAQDDWKVTPKLTLNLGLRYEVFSPVGEQFGRQAMLNLNTITLEIPKGPNQNAPLPPSFAASYPLVNVQRGALSKWLVPWDKDDFGPRLGIAYHLQAKTVVRAGYGIFYGGEQPQGGSPNLGTLEPFTRSVSLVPPNAASFIPNLTTFSAGFPTDIWTLNVPIQLNWGTEEQNFKAAMVNKWNVAVERELGWNTIVDVSYIGDHGTHEIVEENANQLYNSPNPDAPVATRYPYPEIQGGIGDIHTYGFSNYNALAAKVEHRLTNGLDFLTSYTYGHALSDAMGGLNGSPGYGNKAPRDVSNYSANYANGSWDVRQRFVFSSVYDLPFGRGQKFGSSWNRLTDATVGNWKASMILTLQTGQPFTIETDRAVCACGGNTLPDLVPGTSPNAKPPGGRTANEWFNINNFENPAIGTYGDLGLQSNYGPGIRNIDFSLSKLVPLTERFKLQIQGEAFNLFNTTRFNIQDIGQVQGQGNFGTVSGTVPGSPRHLMVAMRLQF